MCPTEVVVRAASAPETASARPSKRLSPAERAVLLATSPLRETGYLARTFAKAATAPTRGEVIGGVVSKGPAFVLSASWWASLFLPAHPAAFVAAVGLSLGLEVFHGIFINTWQNIQKLISRDRGLGYQTAFNLLYMQSTAAAFRVITWAVIPKTIAPWQLAYWRDMGVTTLVGTFFGTLGYNGLNALHEKGHIGRGLRSAIQQTRDLFFLLGGVFFASGAMSVFWPMFLAQQGLDLGIYLAGTLAKVKPGSEAALRASEEAAQKTPMQQAMQAVLSNPLFAPIAVAIAKLRGGEK